jgi:hypothetical protein
MAPYTPAPAVVSRTPADQTALASATYVMNGLGAIASVPCALTPLVTGRVLVMISGDIVENATAQTATLQLSYGTGAAPANGAAVTGTQTGGQLAWVSLTGQLTQTFALTNIITGLTVGTAYWFDIAGKSSAGTVQLTNLNFAAVEL